MEQLHFFQFHRRLHDFIIVILVNLSGHGYSCATAEMLQHLAFTLKDSFSIVVASKELDDLTLITI